MNQLRNKSGKWFSWKYWLMDLHRFVLSIFWIGYRVKKIFIGEPYAVKGAAIAACNHRGYGDSLVLYNAYWYRRMFYLTSDAAMSSRFKSAMMSVLGCVKVCENSADIASMHRCMELLSKGHMLAVFPQGDIFRDGSLNETDFKTGIVLLAVCADVPIIPMYEYKRKNFLRRTKLVVGQPVYCKDYIAGKLPTVAEMERISKVVYEKMAECKEKYEMITGGRFYGECIKPD